MTIEMEISSPAEGELSFWSALPDIDQVDGALTERDNDFLSAVGSVLAKHGATEKFVITLLHSHLRFSAREGLVEALDPSSGFIVSTIRDLHSISDGLEFAPKSWMFSATPVGESKLALRVLSWAPTCELPQGPVNERELGLLLDIEREFSRHGMAGRFGIALAGILPEPGMLWTEGTDLDSKSLIQEQLPELDVLARDPIMTQYKFDGTGRFRITLGCCVQQPSGRGHGKARHPWGLTGI